MEGKTSWQFSKSLSLEKINFLEQTQNTDSRKTNRTNVANTRCTLYMSVVDGGRTT